MFDHVLQDAGSSEKSSQLPIPSQTQSLLMQLLEVLHMNWVSVQVTACRKHGRKEIGIYLSAIELVHITVDMEYSTVTVRSSDQPLSHPSSSSAWRQSPSPSHLQSSGIQKPPWHWYCLDPHPSGRSVANGTHDSMTCMFPSTTAWWYHTCTEQQHWACVLHISYWCNSPRLFHQSSLALHHTPSRWQCSQSDRQTGHCRILDELWSKWTLKKRANRAL